MKNVTHTSRSAAGKKIVSLALCAAVTASGFAAIGMVSAGSVSAAEYGLTENIQDGTILHCFDWKYADIIDELPNIAKAGFSSIQTSPAQPAAGQGAWYWLYQPTSFSAGNDLGSREELKNLCTEADKYGIKVIVDVVANHLAGDHSVIQEDLRDPKYYHTVGELTGADYRDRTKVTQGDIGMQDLNSEDSYVQQVVLNYINDLKSLGVDGIRWDAAKHIALPSEGCDFWKTVTATGLYNYGEILNGPSDAGGGEDIMKEYTKYMSVTDNKYGDNMLASFVSGKAPNFDGNWVDKGLDADHLVYWGESHDTYAGEKGKGSNGASQNMVDRAYAVAAARADASALYLSRPEAVDRESIRIGVKGVREFSSDAIAAVNHFHNAMVGKADAYGVSDNCSVVTRQGGGAVIVCGSGGDKAVEVENVENYVPDGTYIDDVTGNVFTVENGKIKGTVGDTGIAVLVENPDSRVSASRVSGTQYDDFLQLTLRVIGASNATFTTSEGASGTYENGDALSLGENTKKGESVTLTLSATNQNGEPITETYVYNRRAEKQYPTLNGGGVVFDNSVAGWKTVNVYVYDEITTSETITNGSWPGVKMEDCGDNLYKYELPAQFEPCKHIMVIFNNGEGDQIPGAMQAGMSLTYTQKKLYNGTEWGDLPDPAQASSEESSKPSSQESSKESSQESSKESSQESSKQSSQESSKQSSSNSQISKQSQPTSTASQAQQQVVPYTVEQTVNNVETAKTGDGSMAVVFVLVLVSATAGLVAFKTYKKGKED